jgi:hypothetical protein
MGDLILTALPPSQPHMMTTRQLMGGTRYTFSLTGVVSVQFVLSLLICLSLKNVQFVMLSNAEN